MSAPRRQQSQAQVAALDRAYRAERRRTWTRILSLVAVCIVLVSSFIWLIVSRGTVVERNQFDATVTSWTRDQDYTGAGDLYITVKLDNGRDIVVRSSQSLAPAEGTQITVQENIYESGGRKFKWPPDRLP